MSTSKSKKDPISITEETFYSEWAPGRSKPCTKRNTSLSILKKKEKETQVKRYHINGPTNGCWAEEV
jgi:hypothetical protein